MTIVSKTAVAVSLALTTLFAALPAATAYPHPYRHANRLDQRADRADFNGNFGRSARLRRRAGRIRHRTYDRRHGY